MSVRQCIQSKRLTGKLAPKEADEAEVLFDQLRNEFRKTLGSNEADLEAAAALERIMRERAEQYRFQTGLQILADKRNLDLVSRHSRGVGNGVLALLDKDIYGDLNGIANVSSVHAQMVGRAHSLLFGTIEKFRVKGLSLVNDKAGEERLLKAILDGAPDKDMAGHVDAWKQATEMLAEQFRKRGGIIPQGDDRIYFPNPRHDAAAINKVGRTAWKAKVIPLLDREKMLDFETGRPMDDLKFETVLNEAYETLASGGISKSDGAGRGAGWLARARAAPRILRFRDADSWSAYNAEFGEDGIYGAMMGHVDRIAREIAAMDVLGPNPDAAMARFTDLIRQEHGALAGAKASHAAQTYRVVAAIDPIENPGLAAFGGAVRSWLTGQQLGSAMLTAVTDFGFMKQTAGFNGLSAARAMKYYTGLMNPASSADRTAAARMGIVVENALGAMHAQARFSGAAGAQRFAGRYADWVMRASGLAPHTYAARVGFQQEIFAQLSDQAGKDWAALPRDFRAMLKRYGLDGESWERLRATDGFEHRGQRFLTPLSVEEGVGGADGARLGQAIARMAWEETERAVPKGSARVEALLRAGTQRGSVIGEAVSFLTMYKRFPILIIQNHLARAIFDRQGGWIAPDGGFSRGKYLAGLAIYTTMMGAFALQLYEISNGRDPMAMDDATFWGKAALKGGSLGFFGDFLTSADGTNRYGRDLISSMAGPGFGLGQDIVDLTFGNAGEALRGEDTRIGREVVRFADRYLLPGTSLWYSKLAMDRLIIDQLQMLADPQAAHRNAALERRVRKETGQSYFWRPGRLAPERAPDPGAIRTEENWR